jgi:hypothetical protein
MDWGDTPWLKKALFRQHMEASALAREITARLEHEVDTTPDDAWAFRLRHWYAPTGEQLVGAWHRTTEWVRRDGTYAGLISECRRVYNSGADMELVGAPDMHPVGYLCVDCFGIDHSDKVLGSEEE